jgi:hypothetical protein
VRFPKAKWVKPVVMVEAEFRGKTAKDCCGTRHSSAFARTCRRRLGEPEQISTSYVERLNLTVGMGVRRFTRLTNGFSKRLENHLAADALYIAHYNLCRHHEAIRTTPTVALGIAQRAWTIGDLLGAALPTQPITPTFTAPDRRKLFRVIEGGGKGRNLTLGGTFTDH